MLSDELVKQLPRGRSYLADQLKRASVSIPLNIAEGAGEFAAKEKSRFYRMAKRSATECAAILDVCNHLGLVETDLAIRGRELLARQVAMLIRLVRNDEESGSGSGGGSGTPEGT